MRLLTKTPMKVALLVLLTVAATATARAQDGRIKTEQLDALVSALVPDVACYKPA